MGVIKWLKISVGMSDDEKMRLIDAMPKGETVFYFWFRLLIQAAKNNARGKIYLSENVPYTKEMLAIIFNRPVETVEFALKVLSDLKMIEIYENGIINIINWEKHQNVEAMDRVREQTRKRVEKYRAKDKCNVTVTEQKEKEKEKENKNKKEKEIKTESECESDNKKKIKTGLSEEGGEKKEDTTKEDSNEVMMYIKSTSKKFAGTSLSAVKLAVSTHGERNVKLAIDKAIEVNKLRMNYVNGILNNWQIEGYPSDQRQLPSRNFTCEYNKQKTLSFNNFEPRKYDYDLLEKGLLGW